MLTSWNEWYIIKKTKNGGNNMKVLVAKRKGENKLRYYDGKMFVIGKSRAVDISRNSDEVIQKYIEYLYDYLETLPSERGTIDYFVLDC